MQSSDPSGRSEDSRDWQAGSNDVACSIGKGGLLVPQELHDLLKQGQVIPFVGAGFSQVAGFPGWFGLLRHVFDGLVPNQDFDDVVTSCGSDPLRVAEYLLIRSGSKVGPIRHRMSQVLRTPNNFISSAHIDLLNLHLPILYTTNFDELIEETFRLFSTPIATICNARDLAVARGGSTQLVKFHGDLR